MSDGEASGANGGGGPEHPLGPTGTLAALRALRDTAGPDPARSSPLAPPSEGSLEAIFPRSGDYAVLSDCENACLLAPTGAVEWLCLPRPHDPSVFGTLLDRAAGSFRLGAAGTAGAAERFLVCRHRG